MKIQPVALFMYERGVEPPDAERFEDAFKRITGQEWSKVKSGK